MFVRWFHRAHACLAAALLGTAACTAALVCAVCSEHWEHIAWDRAALHTTASAHNWSLDWLLDGQVARLLPGTPSGSPVYLLVPMHGGIWSLCAALDEREQSVLQRLGGPRRRCADYLAEARGPVPGWQQRMQNLSISCALVCLILLGSSAVVGAFGVIAHQVSAVLVTGVLYLLAATFATFTLAIHHLKRVHGALRAAGCGGTTDGMLRALPGVPLTLPMPSGGVPGSLWGQLAAARRVQGAWSLHLGWAGVAASLLTAALWIALSKAMRHGPLAT